LTVLVETLLIARRALREQIYILHRRLLAVVREDDVCRRLMTIPGVGPVVALTYRVTVDVPARFKNSKAVGAAFGLTPTKYFAGSAPVGVQVVEPMCPYTSASSTPDQQSHRHR
jgi:transposase